MSEGRHPGINIHKLPVGGGFVGILFAIGSAAIFVLGFPTLWYFVAFSACLGVAIAALIRFFHQSRSDRKRPLSILTVEGTRENLPKASPRDNGNLFHAVPSVITA